MEQKIEGVIDQGLESISTGLYTFSIGFGFVLIILGALLLFRKRRVKEKKGISYGGLVCLVLGILAIHSGLMQM